jgi:signal recognition particle subunit SRP54
LIIKASRKKRIAKGSGVSVQDVNKLLKSYSQTMKMVKKFNKGGMGALKNMLPF